MDHMETSFGICLASFVLFSVCTAQLTVTPPGQVVIQENVADILLFNGTYTVEDTNCRVKVVDSSCNIPGVIVSTSYDVSTPGVCTFNVTLVNAVDYEKNTALIIRAIVHLDCSGIETQKTLNKFVIVENLKDEPPVFTSSIYSVSVPENHLVNSAILQNIQATDADGIDNVHYNVSFVDQQEHMFQVRYQSNPEILDIYLISPLDFEQQHMHKFTITAIDTVGMNSTCEVLIKVINIQDTPPKFTALQYNGRVSEEAKVGTTVLKVSATDGDSVSIQDQWEGTISNEIYYSILHGDVGMFGINSSTGAIMTVKELDIDSNPNVTNGLVVLTVLAEELNTSMEPQYGDSSATVLVLIQIEDANDNRPQFNSPSFAGSIRADAVEGELVTIERGGYISVFDIDQAVSNNRFSLHIEKDGKPWDVFKTTIESQYAYASIMIQLNKNNSLADYGEKFIKFQIVAQESGNLSLVFPPTTSEMTVWVKALTVSATVPDPAIHLPLSTSDIIIFVVGCLLLLNIGLTIFVCFAMKNRGGHLVNFFNRNSKYYVSERENGVIENDTPYNKHSRGDGLHTGLKHGKNTSGTSESAQAQANMNETEGFQIRLQETSVSNINENKLQDNAGNGQTALSLDDGRDKANDSSTSQQYKLDSGVTTGQGRSNFLQKIQQKLGGENKYDKENKVDITGLHNLNKTVAETGELIHEDSTNSFLENISDGVLLIKSSHAKAPNEQTTFSANSPDSGEKFKESAMQISNYQNLPLTKAVKPDKPTTNMKTDDRNNMASDGCPAISQLTQTTVPPIALAIPFSTGTLQLNKENQDVVTNPIFLTSLTTDIKQIIKSPPELNEKSLASTSETLGISNSLSSPPPPVEDDTQSQKTHTDPGDHKANKDVVNQRGSELSSDGTLDESPSREFSLTDPQLNKNTSIFQHLPTTQDTTDFVAGAKSLLTTAVMNTRSNSYKFKS